MSFVFSSFLWRFCFCVFDSGLLLIGLSCSHLSCVVASAVNVVIVAADICIVAVNIPLKEKSIIIIKMIDRTTRVCK